MVKIFGIRIGEKEDDAGERKKECKHPLMQRGMRLNPEKNAMEIYCKKCGATVVED